MRAPPPSQAAFAVTFLGLGVLGLIDPAYAGVWQPQPGAALSLLCALLALAAGAGLLWSRTAAAAAWRLAAALLAWLLLARLPPVLRAPLQQQPWSGFGETALVLAGAFLLALSLGRADAPPRAWRAGRGLAGLALIPFGTAHFTYARFTAKLVPAFLPAHLAIAYGTGAAYVAAGAALLTGLAAGLAARLVTIQMGLFTLLIWGPVLAAGPKNAGQRSEPIISVALTTAGWLVADSCRSRARPDGQLARGSPRSTTRAK